MILKFVSKLYDNVHKKEIQSLEETLSKIKTKFGAGNALGYFSILGLAPTTDKKKIKDAYRTIVKKYHPDITGNESDMIRKVNEAYASLTKNSFDEKESKIKIYNELVDSYNKLLDKDYKKLKIQLSVPVEEWVYEQAVAEYKNWKKRLKRAFDDNFGQLLRIRKRACGMYRKEKNESYKERLMSICSEAKALEEIAKDTYSILHKQLEKSK
ncbi:MAG: J domain-containing protein [Candidatus Micrarchaeia archaeon]